jgi:gliding motility-associated-like protein
MPKLTNCFNPIFMRIHAFLVLIFLLAFSSLFCQPVALFSYNGAYKAPAGSVVAAGTKLTLNRAVLRQLTTARPQEIEISLPVEGEVLVLRLSKANLFSNNKPDVVLAGNFKQYRYTAGYYLQGKIRQHDQSIAAISIFDSSVGGVISYKGDNYNICVANDENDHASNDYIIYADKDYHVPAPQCFTAEDDKPIVLPNYTQRNTSAVGCPVDIYFELANRMYTGQGSNVQNVLNYFTTLFNCMQTLYSNESILVQIREIKVWDVPDPENAETTTRDVLNAFSDRMQFGFNGDLAHYVTYKSLGGGVAWLDMLCRNNSYYRTAVSGNALANYAPFPNYSFTVNVITHETGHNIGSSHTHNCNWPGGPIDNCAAVDAGPCSPGPTPPPGGGTIMSYCHQAPGIGVNFANGFGPLPGDRIRTRVTEAGTFSCICDCSNISLDITTQDIGCGNPTGSATAAVTDGAGPFTYLWSNGATGATATGLAAGIHYVTVTGNGGGCTVIKGCKINTSGNAVAVTMQPATTNVIKCVNETHTMSVVVSSPGNYRYQWYKDNVAITGATATSYTAAASGVYHATAQAGVCIGQSAAVTVSVQNIAPFSIVANGSTAICANDSVRLSVLTSSYSIEWMLNGTPLPGANSFNYHAKTAGNYTARVFSASNNACSRTSVPVEIQVKPQPAAVINPAGNIAVCEGEQAIFSHNAVAGDSYQWFAGTSALAGATSSTFATKTAGNYTLAVTNAGGCTSRSAAAIVAVNLLPDSSLTPVGLVALCEGGTIRLQVNALTLNARYSWYNGSQLINAGAENTLNVSSSGIYSVGIKNNTTGCTSTTDSTKINMIPPPIIFAGNDTVLATGQPHILRAREVTNLGVDRFEWTSAGLDNPYIATPTAILNTDQLYIVKGFHPLGCTATDSVLIKRFKGPEIYVPNAFSPNGDGKHDILKPIVVGLQSFKYFDIYNRAGERLFRTSNPTHGWDGTQKGVPVDPGTYVWLAEGIDYKGEPMVKKGTVIVVR